MMLTNKHLINKHDFPLSILLKAGKWLALIIISVIFAKKFISVNLIFSVVILALFIGTILALTKPKLYFLGLLVTLPLISLTYNIRLPFLGLSSRTGVSGLNLQSFVLTFSLFVFIYYVFSNKYSERITSDSPILKPILFFLLISIFGLFLTPNLFASIPDLFRNLIGFSIFFIAFKFLKTKKNNK